MQQLLFIDPRCCLDNDEQFYGLGVNCPAEHDFPGFEFNLRNRKRYFSKLFRPFQPCYNVSDALLGDNKVERLGSLGAVIEVLGYNMCQVLADLLVFNCLGRVESGRFMQ